MSQRAKRLGARQTEGTTAEHTEGGSATITLFNQALAGRGAPEPCILASRT